ncbi:hypothetical protein SLA2020_157410 [Shorea laevis]
MFLTFALLLALYSIFTYLFKLLWLKPRRLRSRLSSQGVGGPTPSLLLGNLVEIKRSLSTTFSRKSMVKDGQVTHDWASSLFPFLNNWAKQYGSNYMFWIGTLPVLYLGEFDLVKEINLCTSLDLGKSTFLHKFFGPLFGQGLVASSGRSWAYQRKIIAPELHLDKIKEKFSLIVESATSLADSWENKLRNEGSGLMDIRIDEDLRRFFADVISKACFGSTYSDAKEIFVRIRSLHQAMHKKSLLVGLPVLKFLPTKSNIEIWKLEKEIRALILKMVEERKRGAYQRDLLQIVIDGANNNHLSSESATNFIVDNCKNIYLSGQGVTPISASWTLLLLAAHPDWQARVRDEVLEVSGGHLPNPDMLRKLKLLGMVIKEAMRLYPAFAFLSREALEDIKLGSIQVPKGTNIWFPILALHRDRFLWGPDADEFCPERFAKGVAGACKVPQLYMPFGAGSYVCAGQHLAMTELKIVTSLLLSKFSFSISPKYQHAPVFRLNIEPEDGVKLLVKRI